MRLPNKHPQESKLLEFPFAGDLAKGSTILTAELLSITTEAGVDAAPGNVIEGDTLVDNQALQVLLRVRGGLDGCDYFGEVLVVDSDLLRHVIQFTLPVRSRIARN